MLNRLFLIFSLLLIFPLTLNAAGLGKKVSHLAYVKEMKHWSTPDYTRVAITLDKEAVFEKHELGKTPGSSIPSRIYFDIKNARLLPNIKNLTTGDNFLKSVRISQYSPDVVRVVLDVKNVKDYKIFTFSDPFMIIVDVRGEQEAELKAETTPFKPT
ncbi:MAG: AMIN domain-containing protein, partial [Desulfuromonadales bacterium]|nr:AMIN domain-containing protein [Desulfuromonadales bacterium]